MAVGFEGDGSEVSVEGEGGGGTLSWIGWRFKREGESVEELGGLGRVPCCKLDGSEGDGAGRSCVHGGKEEKMVAVRSTGDFLSQLQVVEL